LRLRFWKGAIITRRELGTLLKHKEWEALAPKSRPIVIENRLSVNTSLRLDIVIKSEKRQLVNSDIILSTNNAVASKPANADRLMVSWAFAEAEPQRQDS
jgi:hypothetical protein